MRLTNTVKDHIVSMAIQKAGIAEAFDVPMAWHEGHSLEIPTLEGTMKASPGDYIIKGLIGECYPCKPNVFELTYEPVEEKET